MLVTFKTPEEIEEKRGSIDVQGIINKGILSILDAQRVDMLNRHEAEKKKTVVEDKQLSENEKIAKAIDNDNKAVSLYCIAMKYGYKKAQEIFDIINNNHNLEKADLKAYLESENINNITMKDYEPGDLEKIENQMVA